VEQFELEILNQGKTYDRCSIRKHEINRPALQILGFFDYFDPSRIQVIGKVEWTYLSNQSSEDRRTCFDAFFKYPIPALILTRSLEPFPELMEMAEKHQRTILRGKEATSIFISNLNDFLKAKLSPRITRHGVLVDVSGEGVLIMGESGVGKSETAVELLKRGHRLVADDAVEIRHIGTRLVGSAPEIIRHYIELRGIGVVDVQQLFGMSAVREEKNLDLVVNLEPWNENTFYDRLGTSEEFTTILDMKIPAITIPVKPGRNLAIIVEVAAMNNRHKRMGYNAAQEFSKQLDAHFEQMMLESQLDAADDYDEYDDLIAGDAD
jgi:HPr kinase/phosphorylase